MTQRIYPNPELNIKMGGMVNEEGLQRGQRDDSGPAARENLMGKVDLDTNRRL